jgi:hypothetical protein
MNDKKRVCNSTIIRSIHKNIFLERKTQEYSGKPFHQVSTPRQLNGTLASATGQSLPKPSTKKF